MAPVDFSPLLLQAEIRGKRPNPRFSFRADVKGLGFLIMLLGYPLDSSHRRSARACGDAYGRPEINVVQKTLPHP